MFVQMQTAIAGKGWSASHGDVVEMPDAEAQRYIDRGLATPVEPADPAEIEEAKQDAGIEPDSPVETATAPRAPEQAAGDQQLQKRKAGKGK
jgi:phosphotransacetylase